MFVVVLVSLWACAADAFTFVNDNGAVKIRGSLKLELLGGGEYPTLK